MWSWIQYLFGRLKTWQVTENSEIQYKWMSRSPAKRHKPCKSVYCLASELNIEFGKFLLHFFFLPFFLFIYFSLYTAFGFYQGFLVSWNLESLNWVSGLLPDWKLIHLQKCLYCSCKFHIGAVVPNDIPFIEIFHYTWNRRNAKKNHWNQFRS
jgi:hypothetical protein